MSSADRQWITVHRLRFAMPFSIEDRTFAAPAGTCAWRCCPGIALADNGLPTWRSDVWGAMAIHDSREAAEALYRETDTRIDGAAEAVEQWHAFMAPIAHHGAVNWRGTVEEDAAVRVGADMEGGPLAVITTAGYTSRTPDQIPRIVAFTRGVMAVLDGYSVADGNLCRAVFSGGYDGRDGFTFTLWDDTRAMSAAAYRPGVHKGQMDTHKDKSLFDRSSFTRARVLATKGTWDGQAIGAVANAA